ncbi:MAG: hypothetical protein ACYTJ0_03400 [Planctomycetota bacterium]|jgi:ribosomal protein L37AE/L43A
MVFRAYRMLHAVHESYALGVFWLYLGLFLLTLALIFVFPPVALAMVFLGLAGLLPAVVAGKLLAAIVAALARALLGQGTCPGCASRRLPEPEAADWQCEQCGRSYDRSGREAPPVGDQTLARMMHEGSRPASDPVA